MQDISNTLEIIEHFRRQVPVDVEGLAMALGIPVKRIDFEGNVSGQIKRWNGDKFMIGVNARDAETRQRFTIAHELGHFILHRHLIGNEITDNSAYRADGKTGNPNIGVKEETEANRFAANLLMPAESIIHLRENENITSPQAMAKRLEVSPKSMEIRMNPLMKVLRLAPKEQPVPGIS